MNEERIFSSPAPIERHHQIQDFDCGIPALNKYLKSYALQNHRAGGARTYVTEHHSKVVGYYSLTYSAVTIDEVPARIKAGQGRYPVPVMLLARLAVDRIGQGKGLGDNLLRDAIQRTLQAAEIGGLRAVLVHAKDDNAKRFYQKYDFISSPVDEYHLYLLIKDLRKEVLKDI